MTQAAVLFFACLALAFFLLPLGLKAHVRTENAKADMFFTLFLFFGIPVLKLRFRLRFDPSLGIIFSRVTKNGEAPIKRKRKRKKRKNRFVLPLVRALSLKRFIVFGTLGVSDDAAISAFLSGAANIVAQAALRITLFYLPIRIKTVPRFEILPNFGENGVRLELEGIIETNMLKLIKSLLEGAIKRN